VNVCVCSLNGPTWLPSEFSLICSEHFLELKNVDDPSFIPNLFPMGSIAELQATEKHIAEKDVSGNFSVLEKVADRLPVLSAVIPAGAGPGPVHGRSDTSQLQKAFCELASHVCRLMVAHDSELLIEGTVGVTVDGGARVMLLHFADQVRKTEASAAEQNAQNSVSDSTAVGSMFQDVAGNNAKDETIIKVETGIHSPEETIPGDGNANYGTKLPSFIASSSQHGSTSSKILSELAQRTTNMMYTNSNSYNDAVAVSTHKRKAEPDNSSVCDKPKQQTLLRELLCAPLPPKRPCKPVSVAPVNAAAAATALSIGEVVRLRRPTANSSVLGGLLRTGNYQRDSNFCPVGKETHPKQHEAGTVTVGSYGSRRLGVDAQGPGFGGNAVRALLKLASEHTAAGRHDLLHNHKRQESGTSQHKGFVNSEMANKSLDQSFSVQHPILSGSSLSSTASEFISTSQNVAENDSSTTDRSSSQLEPWTVKQEVVDPHYE